MCVTRLTTRDFPYGWFFYKPNNFYDLIIYIHLEIFFSLLGIKLTDTYIRIYSKNFFFLYIIIWSFDSYVRFARFYHV